MRAAAEGMDGGARGAWALGMAGMAAAVAWFLSPLLGRGRAPAAPVPFAEPTVIAAMAPPAPAQAVEPPAAPEPVAAPVAVPMAAAREIPQSVMDGLAEVLVPSLPPAPSRPEPSPLGVRVVAALDGHEPMRKCDIARLVGVGRGSANRVVDALVASGWLREQGTGHFVLA